MLQEPELQPPPPPPIGLSEVMEKPERYPASRKSTLMAPQVLSSPCSTKNWTPPSSKLSSFSFDSSRANPSEGPAQPPCISEMRIADSILLSARYVLRFSTAELVTSSIITSMLFKNWVWYSVLNIKLNSYFFNCSLLSVVPLHSYFFVHLTSYILRFSPISVASQRRQAGEKKQKNKNG